MLSRFVITFLRRSKHHLISRLQSPSAVILEPKKRKSLTVCIVSPSICHEVMGPGATILAFWMLNFQSAFLLSSFTFIKRLFSSSSLSDIKVVSSVYLKLLMFLTAVLIPLGQHLFKEIFSAERRKCFFWLWSMSVLFGREARYFILCPRCTLTWWLWHFTSFRIVCSKFYYLMVVKYTRALLCQFVIHLYLA